MCCVLFSFPHPDTACMHLLDCAERLLYPWLRHYQCIVLNVSSFVACFMLAQNPRSNVALVQQGVDAPPAVESCCACNASMPCHLAKAASSAEIPLVLSGALRLCTGCEASVCTLLGEEVSNHRGPAAQEVRALLALLSGYCTPTITSPHWIFQLGPLLPAAHTRCVDTHAPWGASQLGCGGHRQIQEVQQQGIELIRSVGGHLAHRQVSIGNHTRQEAMYREQGMP